MRLDTAKVVELNGIDGLRVLLEINHSSEQRGEDWVPVYGISIADRLRLPVRKVKRLLGHLVADGYLERKSGNNGVLFFRIL